MQLIEINLLIHLLFPKTIQASSKGKNASSITLEIPSVNVMCFVGQFALKCSTDPHNLHPPPTIITQYSITQT